jgi:hypothetical protein
MIKAGNLTDWSKRQHENNLVGSKAIEVSAS